MDGRCTSSHENKTFRSRSVVKQKGIVFGFRKTATAFTRPERKIDISSCSIGPCKLWYKTRYIYGVSKPICRQYKVLFFLDKTLWWSPCIRGLFKKKPNFLNSAPTCTESVMRLLNAPSVRFWKQTTICPVSLRALVVELHPLNWARAEAVHRIHESHLWFGNDVLSKWF